MICLTYLAGCGATRVTPPADVKDPVTVYLTDYGRHSSIVLPSAPNRLSEFTFGDWSFYAEGKQNAWTGFVALFFSPQSALGRRIVADPHDPKKLGETLRATVHGIAVERACAQRLQSLLEQRFERHAATERYNPTFKVEFVKDEEHYSLLNNSNQATARWLKDLGCQVHGPAVMSNFVVEQR